MGNIVKAASEMDAETFLKHINARHTPLGGLTVVGKSNIPGDNDENLLRVYHRKAHQRGTDFVARNTHREITHTHREAAE